jgi:hypothetical protein
MAFLTLNNQLTIAVLTVIPEKSSFSTFWTVYLKRQSTRTAICPPKLNGRATSWAPRFKRVDFSAKRTDISVWRDQLTTILAWFLIA